jgi:hypothetical protein
MMNKRKSIALTLLGFDCGGCGAYEMPSGIAIGSDHGESESQTGTESVATARETAIARGGDGRGRGHGLAFWCHATATGDQQTSSD